MGALFNNDDARGARRRAEREARRLREEREARERREAAERRARRAAGSRGGGQGSLLANVLGEQGINLLVRE